MLEALAASMLGNLCSLVAAEGEFLSAVSDDLDWLRDEFRSITAFLERADSRGSREDQSEGNNDDDREWINQLREVAYDSDDIIDEFDLRRRAADSWACLFCHLKSRHEIGSKIRVIRSKLDEISRRKSEYKLESTSLGVRAGFRVLPHRLAASSPLVFHNSDMMVGLEEDLESLLEWLGSGREAELSVISLVGMGGLGKTTLAMKAYNNRDVTRSFDRCSWVYVSQSIRWRELLSEMANGLLGIPTIEAHELTEKQLQERLLTSLQEKRCLVVFDDVWDRQLWEAIKHVLPIGASCGSKVIITTRNSEVASSIVDVPRKIHHLHPLSPHESWVLFCKKVFMSNHPGSCPEELKDLAEAIVKKCDGLPLALVTVGGMISRKERTRLVWKLLLDNIHKEFWNHDDGIRHVLELSYKDLPFALKSCFLLCAAFPPDFEIPRKRLIRLWLAEGLVQDGEGEVLEDVAEEYLMELINRSMLQVSKISSSGRVKACRLHDLLHQLSITIAEREGFLAICGGGNQKTKTTIDARRISHRKAYNNAAWNTSKLKLRSFFLFSLNEPCQFAQNHLLQNFGLLRVLDLEDACLKKLPSQVGGLFHLRFLGLKGTAIEKLPKSMKNLINLQTLDIRFTNLRKLSFEIRHLLRLRHLEMGQVGKCIQVPFGLGSLEKLQVITGLKATGVIVNEIAKLTQLKKLGIEGLQAENAEDICSAVNKMVTLSTLSVFSEDVAKALDFTRITPPPFLQKLHIAGCLEKLPPWFGSIQNLTKLRLGLSQLTSDPLPTLQTLPSLVFLQLYEAYQGKAMSCTNHGFRKLKIFVLTGLEELEEWEVEEGSMPCIQELWFMSCPRLRMIPSGFQFLTTMETLRLVSMPEDFLKRLDNSVGEDFTIVQHIPTIQVIDWNGQCMKPLLVNPYICTLVKCYICMGFERPSSTG